MKDKSKRPRCAINLRDLDPVTHGAFKAACARRGRTIKGLVQAFINEVAAAEIATTEDAIPAVNIGRLSRKHKLPR